MGNFAGALVVAFLMAFIFTYGFSTDPGPVGKKIAGVGVARTLGYAAHGARGSFTIFVRGNAVQLDGVHWRGGSDDFRPT